MGVDSGSMMGASMMMRAGGSLTSAYGAYESGQAQSAKASYQSQVAANNAAIAAQNAQWATAEGQQQVERSDLATRAQVGGIKAAQAANNIDVNSGSALKVQRSQAMMGQLDALTIQSNAARQAYGYEAQAAGFTAESGLEATEASQAKEAGTINAMGSLLSGASSIGRSYAMWQMYQNQDGKDGDDQTAPPAIFFGDGVSSNVG